MIAIPVRVFSRTKVEYLPIVRAESKEREALVHRVHKVCDDERVGVAKRRGSKPAVPPEVPEATHVVTDVDQLLRIHRVTVRLDQKRKAQLAYGKWLSLLEAVPVPVEKYLGYWIVVENGRRCGESSWHRKQRPGVGGEVVPVGRNIWM
jgi:hypothetical protein